ncbi:hypothetical protein [Flavobacterium gawalongense]|uniref:Lipoprotein n=1 Tax=Flavobacterium gawalongense TaxID=2594432 RepID=A0A553BL49_9FLAO|nr:hypothetical protein [Flavobacterium gawalongense]TRX00399.1 hypothetical protein FNW33_11860 [Flavobacterium gawalongense]TRX05054.1 hypothetical protein FNW12_12130 [Flavobacterium gawalongense]TRX08972.1 hypothetical protein FNW11_10555 [Flavobacterium gawalongense]TRX10041.1 hypothetical protein FNW10_10245 [Flavobacterium gawalongense]TRX26926.1 hypothetical protein FNW38_10065 [Flavobacterium gawalongense]
MSKTIKYFYFLFLIISLISCNKENNKTNEVKKVNNKNGEKSLSEKIKSEPKIFLKYWENMTLDEFFEVTSLLSDEKIIENDSYIRFYYLTDLCRVEFKYNFINGKLKSISLVDNIDCIYPIYQKKYNLPDLVDANLLYECYTDNNNNYEPTLTYKKIGQGDKLYQIPDALIDKSNPLKSRNYFNINDKIYNSNYIQEKFNKNEFIIDRDSIFIVFKQSFNNDNLPSTIFSLEQNEEAMSAMQNINGDGFGTLNNPGTGITGDIIMKNSRTLTVYKKYTLEKSITYLSKKEYYNRKKILENSVKRDSLENKIEETKTKSRKEKSINEI